MEYPFTLANAKNILQTHCVHQRLGEPIYTTKSLVVGMYGFIYLSTVNVGRETFRGSTYREKKVEAEKDVAFEACELLFNEHRLYVTPSELERLEVYKELDKQHTISLDTSKNLLEHYSVTRHVERPHYESIFESKTSKWRSSVVMTCAYNGLKYTAETKIPDKNKTTSEKMVALDLCLILMREDPDYIIPRVFMQK